MLESAHVLMTAHRRRFRRGTELLAAGLDVRQVTRIAMALQARGLPIDPAVYTVEALERSCSSVGKGGAKC